MDFLSAFAIGNANRGKEMMVFDWDGAARMIVERCAKNASAGLRGDWERTGGDIFSNGKPIKKDDTYTYLASTWAVPEIEIDGEIIACYKMQSQTDGWDAKTYWPESSLNILNSAGAK